MLLVRDSPTPHPHLENLLPGTALFRSWCEGKGSCFELVGNHMCLIYTSQLSPFGIWTPISSQNNRAGDVPGSLCHEG